MDLDNLLLLVWIAFTALFMNIPILYREELAFGERKRCVKPIYAIIVFIPIFIFCVYGKIRSDTYAYLAYYRNLPNSLSDALTYIQGSDRPGFDLFSIFIKSMFGGSETAYRFMLCLIHSIPLIAIYRKYSYRYLFTIYLFCASGIHLGWMTNGIRQFMACTLMFATTPWIIEKKYIRTIVVILIASTIHRSALIMVPIVFIVQGKTWNKRSLLFILATILATFVLSRDSSLFNQIASDFGYSLEASIQAGDDGANPIRALVNAVPMILAYVFRKQIENIDNPLINVCVNMSVITSGIYLVATVTSGIMIGRLPIYTSLYNLILLPFIIDYVVPDKMKGIIRNSCIVLYFIYFIYEIR